MIVWQKVEIPFLETGNISLGRLWNSVVEKLDNDRVENSIGATAGQTLSGAEPTPFFSRFSAEFRAVWATRQHITMSRPVWLRKDKPK